MDDKMRAIITASNPTATYCNASDVAMVEFIEHDSGCWYGVAELAADTKLQRVTSRPPIAIRIEFTDGRCARGVAGHFFKQGSKAYLPFAGSALIDKAE